MPTISPAWLDCMAMAWASVWPSSSACKVARSPIIGLDSDSLLFTWVISCLLNWSGGRSKLAGAAKSIDRLKWLSPLAVLNDRFSTATLGLAASSFCRSPWNLAFSASSIWICGTGWPAAVAASNSGRCAWYHFDNACSAGALTEVTLTAMWALPTARPSQVISPTLYSTRPPTVSAPSRVCTAFCSRPLTSSTCCLGPRVTLVSASARSTLPT
ncbi:hypothetical protein D3C81_1653490 [compost metagenome]